MLVKIKTEKAVNAVECQSVSVGSIGDMTPQNRGRMQKDCLERGVDIADFDHFVMVDCYPWPIDFSTSEVYLLNPQTGQTIDKLL